MGLTLSMRRYQEVGDQVLTWTARLSVLLEDRARKMRRGFGDGLIADGQAGQKPNQLGRTGRRRGELGKSDGTNNQRAFGRCRDYCLKPES